MITLATPGDNLLSITKSYDPDILLTVPRSIARQELHLPVDENLFTGHDLWTAYEVSWLDGLETPQSGLAQITVDAHSPRIVESKSLQLYLSSMNCQPFESAESISRTIQHDISEKTGGEALINVFSVETPMTRACVSDDWTCLDRFTGPCAESVLSTQHLKRSLDGFQPVREKLYTHTFRSICPVTGQPDWATIFIVYEGKAIDHETLWQYLMSYRQHGSFHEHCIEQVFVDIMMGCAPDKLAILGRFTRRGGIDINPLRTNDPSLVEELPLGLLNRQ